MNLRNSQKRAKASANAFKIRPTYILQRKPGKNVCKYLTIKMLIEG
jgi:hypothetical protein